MANIEEKTENLVMQTINDLGYNLYDIIYTKEGQDNYLKIFIDNKKGISLDDCEKVNNAITDMLDKAGFIKDQYFLEISSPGIERILRKDKHLEENIGKEVNIKLYKILDEPKEEIKKGNKKIKELQGILKEFDENKVIITDDNNKDIVIQRNNIALMKTVYNWN